MRDHTKGATDRELAVVAAVVAAGSEKAAAHRLGMSQSTVKHHLASARSRVGASSTAQLVWILGPTLPEPERGSFRALGDGPQSLSDATTPGSGRDDWPNR